jgi:glutamate 5-kinase
MKGCIERLVHDAVIPILNENDVISTEELLFTDNDELAGLVASMTGASKVIILSSVAGVLANGKAVPSISLQDISEAEKHVGVGVSVGGRGGMASKFRVAKKLMLQGIGVHIADGRKPNVIISIMEEKPVGTMFVPSKILPSVKRRIAHSEGLALGTVRVNQCFEETLLSPEAASLLPVGMLEVQGDFEKGDVVEIVGETGRHLGFGIAAYGPEAARRVIGMKRQRPFIHYDYMFIEA